MNVEKNDHCKSIAIMQPYLFPYLGYFQLIKAADIFVIYDDVNYINKSYINRNSILLNAQPHQFTLTLSSASQNKLINQIKVANNAHKILKTIEITYKKAPFFIDTFPLLQDILCNKEQNLAIFIGNSLQVISKHLGLNISFLYSSNIEKDNTLKSENKLIEICKKLEATTYINAIGGQQLYSKYIFKKQNIDLMFLKSLSQKYKQFKCEFVPNLSIIDVLMFNSKTQVIEMLEQYELI